MKGEFTMKVRVVICPKCRELLPELPDLDVYKCGVCGTILQAKRPKHNSVTPVAVAARSDGSDVVPKCDESGHETRLEMSSSECVSPEDSEGDQKRSKELNGENVGCVSEVNEEQRSGNRKNLSDSITDDNRFSCEAFSSELSHSDTEGSPALVPVHMLNSPVVTGSDSSWCSLSLGEEGSPSTQAEDEGNYVVVGKSRRDQNETNSTSERSTKENLVTMARNHSHNSASRPMGDNIESIPSSLDEQLQYAHKISELNVNESKSTSKSLSVENPVSVKGNNSHFSAPRPVGTTSSNYGLTSSEQLHQDQQNIYARSMDENGTRDPVSPVKKLDETCRNVLDSSVSRSLHANNGSISSCDGIEVQFFNQNPDPLETSARVSVSDERHNRHGSLVSNRSRDRLKTQLHRRDFSSELSCKKHYAMREMKQDQNEFQDGMKKIHDSRVKNWMGTDRHEYHSRMSHFPRAPRADFQSRSLSDQFSNDFHYSRSRFDSPDMYDNPYQERMKLLKMVHELQDQLQRTGYFDGNFKGRVATHDLSKEIHASAHNNLDAYERKHLHEYHNRRYPGRCRHGSNWQETHKYSRIPFSAEASTSRRPHDHPCIHCHTQDFRYSEELHPAFHCRKSDFCLFHLDYNCCICQSSCSPSPRRFVDSEFQRLVHNDHRRRSHELKNFLREKQRRHFLPIAGGAPFITCQNCYKLLQLPEEFLVCKRRCHLIKCGSCSKVLKFSLLDRSHLVSYPVGIEPPPSTVDSFETVPPMDNPMPLLDAGCSATADHVSYSDYNGLSVCKSNSCKDPAALSTIHHFHQNVHNGTHSCDSKEKRRDEGGLRPSLDKTKAPANTTDESTRPSSGKIRPELPSSDKEEQPSPQSSPLHRLMGYSSPSHIIIGTPTLLQGTSSSN